jgi:hypothetical protein
MSSGNSTFTSGKKLMTSLPWFQPFAPLINALNFDRWPDWDDLNSLLEIAEGEITNASGQPIRFVPQHRKPRVFEERFEQSAYLRGEVLVRPNNWHDLINALVWMRFPKTKAALNARHFTVLKRNNVQGRSSEGDALTIFDESGVIIISRDEDLVDRLSGHRWVDLFWRHREQFIDDVQVVLFGHGLLEKSMTPFVGMTGKAVVVSVPKESKCFAAGFDQDIDGLAEILVSRTDLMTSGRGFFSLPILGVPGWWAENERLDFYQNQQYFRSKKKNADNASLRRNEIVVVQS